MRYDKKKMIGTIAVVCLIFIAIFCYFFGGRPSVLGIFKNGAYGTQVDLDTTFGYRAEKYNGGVAVFGKEGLTGISHAGRTTWKIDFHVTEPLLSCAGRYVLAAERGGNNAILVAGGKQRKEIKTQDEILTLSVNRKGTSAIVTKERGYKGCVKVYTAGGKEVYTWHSAEQNILTVALSEDSSRLAVSVVNMKDLSQICTVYLFDLKSTQPNICAVGDENLAATLFFNGNELIAVGDEAMYCFKKDGQQKFKVDYAGRDLQKCCFHEGSILALEFISGINGSSVELYDSNGHQKGICTVQESISGMDTMGGYTVVNAQNKLLVISRNGKIVSKSDLHVDAQQVFLCGSRNRIFALSGTSAGMYII